MGWLAYPHVILNSSFFCRFLFFSFFPLPLIFFLRSSRSPPWLALAFVVRSLPQWALHLQVCEAEAPAQEDHQRRSRTSPRRGREARRQAEQELACAARGREVRQRAQGRSQARVRPRGAPSGGAGARPHRVVAAGLAGEAEVELACGWAGRRLARHENEDGSFAKGTIAAWPCAQT